MQCLYPISIQDPKSTNGADRLIVPCGRCAACLSNRRQEWVTRLEQELKDSYSAYFLTITYAQTPVIDGKETLVKKDLQDWFKRLRKALKGHTDEIGKSIKYYAVGEYGSITFRPHYHAIMFNLPCDEDKALLSLLKSWDKGFIMAGTVTSESINYTLKYMLQSADERKRIYDGRQLPFSLMSKGLGERYIEKYKKWHLDDKERNYVVKQDGQRFRLPRYFREKIYSDTDRRLQYERSEKRRLSKVYDGDLPTLESVRYESEQLKQFERRTKAKQKVNKRKSI